MAIPKTDPRGVRSEVQEFLDGLARALASGDGDAIAKMYEVPALIVSDDGVIALESAEQIAKLFGAAKVHTRASVLDLERIGTRIIVSTVRWPHLDANHREVGAESSDYTLRRDDNGRLRIRSVLMRGLAAQPKQ